MLYKLNGLYLRTLNAFFILNQKMLYFSLYAVCLSLFRFYAQELKNLAWPDRKSNPSLPFW